MHQTGIGQSASCMTGNSVALRQKMLAIESDIYRDVSSNVNPREDVFSHAPFTAFPCIPDYMSALWYLEGPELISCPCRILKGRRKAWFFGGMASLEIVALHFASFLNLWPLLGRKFENIEASEGSFHYICQLPCIAAIWWLRSVLLQEGCFTRFVNSFALISDASGPRYTTFSLWSTVRKPSFRKCIHDMRRLMTQVLVLLASICDIWCLRCSFY